jgi:fatty-acyl-CoA synthase
MTSVWTGTTPTVALSPLSFLERTARVYPHRLAIVHGTLRQTWAQTFERCRRLASALQRRGIGAGDTVAAMLPNTPPMFEAHFGVPVTGAVLNTLNTRLDPEAIAFQLDHGEAKVLLTDREFSSTIARALALMTGPRPLVIDVLDAEFEGGKTLGELDYETFVAEGDPSFAWTLPADEWQAISLNYTSGTTGNPKGVVTHHRGAYLNAVATSSPGPAAAPGVPVDAADVPLQRLVLPLDDGAAGRGERLPAPGGSSR